MFYRCKLLDVRRNYEKPIQQQQYDVTGATYCVLGPFQPPIQLVLGGGGVKRPGTEADYSPPSSAKMKNV